MLWQRARTRAKESGLETPETIQAGEDGGFSEGAERERDLRDNWGKEQNLVMDWMPGEAGGESVYVLGSGVDGRGTIY